MCACSVCVYVRARVYICVCACLHVAGGVAIGDAIIEVDSQQTHTDYTYRAVEVNGTELDIYFLLENRPQRQQMMRSHTNDEK